MSSLASMNIDGVKLELGLHIGGALRQGAGATFPLLDPATEDTLAQIGGASSQEVDDALKSAQEGMQKWQVLPPQGRSRILAAGAQKIRENKASIALVLSVEQGKPLPEAMMEVELTAETFDWYAAETLRIYGRIIPPRAPNAVQTITPRPIGVVACFTPWNFPLLLSARKVAPALAAGCACILKPAEETIAAPLAMTACLYEAGLPEGALNVVFGDAPRISEQIIASPLVRTITFTGSTAIGRDVARVAAEHLKPCTLELGGHAPVIILADADIDSAVAAAVGGKTRNAGQVCTSPTRFYVADKIYGDFVDAFSASLSALKVGKGRDDGVQMGPLANERRLRAAENFVQDAVETGARIAAGGQRLGNRGYFFQPTLLADVSDRASIMSVEPFCPIAAATPFSDVDSAIAKANGLRAGLAGYIFSKDFAAAEQIAKRLEVGQIGINTFAVSHVEATFGGVKESGYGTEGSTEAMEAFLTRQYVHHVIG